MIIDDVSYDGTAFSELGYTICDFEYSDGFNEVSVATGMTFNQVKINGGAWHPLVNTSYEEPLEFEFGIVKDREQIENPEDYVITEEEFQDLVDWLNRGRFTEMIVVGDMGELYFNASSNVSKVYIGGQLIGAKISVTTDRPYAMQPAETAKRKTTKNNETITVNYYSQKAETYPEVEIVCGAAGDLVITNELTGSVSEIKNCRKNEIIYFSGETLIAKTNQTTHELWDSFNFVFLTLGATYVKGIKVMKNPIAISLPCEITITYRPVLKNLG